MTATAKSVRVWTSTVGKRGVYLRGRSHAQSRLIRRSLPAPQQRLLEAMQRSMCALTV